MKYTRLLALALSLLFPVLAHGQRLQVSINDGWTFSKPGDRDVKVSFPHTWNNIDADDETPGYYRGPACYSKKISIPEFTDGQRVTVHFEGANQVTALSVNGTPAGTHTGGYTAFAFDITDLLVDGENMFEITVDNSFNKDIPPLSADFTFFGGVYRDVYLVITPEVHISTTYHASAGVFATTDKIDGTDAEVGLRSFISNPSPAKKKAVLSYELIAEDGAVAASLSRKITIPAATANYEVSGSVRVPNAHLWDVDDPHVYSLVVRLSCDGKTDETIAPFGIRTYSFDPDGGFFLNGRHVKLMGTCRHQDYLGMGNALPDEMHERDIRLLKEMGGNYIRIAHYPQDPVILSMCNRNGILSSVEIPVVNTITENENFRSNCLEMVKEMMYQNFNNPSVIVWAYNNEVLLRPPYDKKQKAEREVYFEHLRRIIADCDGFLHENDPARYTMLPCHSAAELYKESGATDLPQILGFNIYDGWYRENVEHFGTRLDGLHEMFPDKILMVTEYGADVDPRIHSFLPQRFDFSNEFAMIFHEHYMKVIKEKDFIAGSNIWNLNDFYSETRGEAVPHVNNKGITGLDRTKKDTYYLYQAGLLNTPVLHICGKDWVRRSGERSQIVKVYSNAGSISAELNGRKLGEVRVVDNVARLDVDFIDGANQLVVRGDNGICDIADFIFTDVQDLSNFSSINVMAGSTRYFIDRKSECTWLPDQMYDPEGGRPWGSVGGRFYMAKSNRGAVPASVDEIKGTDIDPVYQTQRKGIESFIADVPDGQYSVYLYFAELEVKRNSESAAYTFGVGEGGETHGERVFDVKINDVKVLQGFDVANQCGEDTAVCRKFRIPVTGGRGLRIDFVPQSGEAILNAIRIYKE